MIIQTVLDMNSPVVDIEIEEPELTEKTDDDITDIPPQIDEFDNAIYFDNDDMAANGFHAAAKSRQKNPMILRKANII